MVFALTSTLGGLPIALIYHWLSGRSAAAVVLLAIVGMAGFALSIRVTRHLDLASTGSVASMVALFFYMGAVGGGSPSLATLSWFALVPVIASFVGGTRQGLVWGAVAVFGALSFSVAPLVGHPYPASRVARPELLAAMLNIAFVVIMVAVAALFQHSKEIVQQELVRLALFDTLTGLPNRRNLDLLAQGAAARSQRTGTQTAMLYLDLDGFKSINDRHGHATGDDVLRAFAQRLLATVRSTDTVARLSGDEFVVLLEQISQPQEAVGVAQAILGQMNQPLAVGSAAQPFAVSTSIGIACSGSQNLPFDQLLVVADHALYAAKSAGRGRYQLAA